MAIYFNLFFRSKAENYSMIVNMTMENFNISSEDITNFKVKDFEVV